MKNLSIKGKFAAIILIFSGTIISVFSIGMMNLSKIHSSGQYLDTEIAETRSHANRALFGMYQATIDQRDLIQLNEVDSKPVLEKFHASIASFREHMEQLAKRVGEKHQAKVAQIRQDFERWLVLAEKGSKLGDAGKYREAFEMMRREGNGINEGIERSLQEILEDYRILYHQIQQENESTYLWSRNLGISLSLIGLILGISFSTLIARNLIRGISTTVEILTDSAAQVASASRQIASASNDLSQAATSQASSLEETSAAVEEMSSMVGRNAQASRESSTIAQESVAVANKGQTVVQAMLASMQSINEANNSVMAQTNESNQRLNEIVSVINEIGSKTKIINEIVFQTKLLSFNASVEAARAGENGKGFAVVADEVGKLAQMSGNAAKDITTLLEGSIDKVEGIIRDSRTKMEHIVADNTAKIQDGSRIAVDCREVLNEIVGGINSVSRMVATVAEASDEQARGVGEINKAIIQLDQVTQTNAATSEESASASEELSAQAEHLKATVQALAGILRGDGSSAPNKESSQDPTSANTESSLGQSISNVIRMKRNLRSPEPQAEGLSGDLKVVNK